jgi:Kef-type K+ transport system membrane component KefB
MNLHIVNLLPVALPLTDPVLKFFIILVIILFAPILLNRIKIPHLLGLIIAGAVIGPYGFNLVGRDSGMVLSGTAGLLYIMFLAGIEIDIADFKKNAFRSTFLGLTGFLFPMIIGTLTGFYFLNFSFITSVLLASMFASHTLITYPIVSKLGITKNRAVNITVGSTLITNILALLVLAIVVGATKGEIDQGFWIKLIISFIIFTSIISFGFPLIARWFFKRFNDNVLQYIFVLVMVYLGAVLSQIAGIEAIIGAFIAGLALNRLIPRTSPLMNRIDLLAIQFYPLLFNQCGNVN